jgi:superfamily II DNA/RNA helicase
VLGNVNVFVMASVEPAALLHSKAALAQAIVRQGLVQRAMQGGGDGLPTLRGIVAQAIAGAGEATLVYAERVWALRYLAQTLRERHGVDARVADGAVSPAEFAELKRAFMSGEYDVLLLSRVGAEGHNLQRAETLIMLDQSWVPGGIEQRVGRAVRPGSPHAAVATMQPYIRGGGVEYVTQVVAPRAGETHLLLDSYEGLAADQSVLALQLGELTKQVAESKAEQGWAATAARLRVAASVFGS